MKDFRLPRTSTHRSKRRVKKPQRSSRASGSTNSSGFIARLFKWPLRILGLLAVLGGVGFVAFRFLLPQLLPLDQNTNIVFVSSKNDLQKNEIVVAHFRSADHSLSLITLQNQELVSVIGGFGEYPLRSVYPLLALEEKGSVFARGAFSYVTGQLVDGVVAVPGAELPRTQTEVMKALSVYPGSGIESSMEQLQVLRLLLFAAKLPSDNLTHTTTSSLSEWESYRAKRAVKHPENECSVAVVNTTSKGGLAREMSAILEQTGYTVVRITDTATNEPQTIISYNPDDAVCELQAKRLADLFPLVITMQPNREMTSTYRAKIVISLGQDVSQLR